ncbi:MAG: aldehyde dehydrogenase (NADP(+)) [Octadecabacter sp.]|nr:aldehyde dehydrogenase (NADP(+)) [Octadecabacter sp.]
MSFKPHGKHLIAGTWVNSMEKFQSEPAHGDANDFSVGTTDLVEKACAAAEDAFATYGYSSREERALFLNTIADEIDARGADVTAIGTSETGLPAGRIEGERGRTTGQLRLFSKHILTGDYLDRRYDKALPDRNPLPRPDLRTIQRPIGPVAVFGASNFPLAFSTAGGDTAAALAAGCPVVVKGHGAHPGTGEVIADAIHTAIKKCNLHPGVFSLVQGGNRTVGQALVTNEHINAVGFTGSLGGGRALFDLCAARPKPIPFFGELGSVNPMFMMTNAIAARGKALGTAWAASLLMGAGQFCTNPGIAIVVKSEAANAFIEATKAALDQATPQTMLTNGIANAYGKGVAEFRSAAGVQELIADTCTPRTAVAALYRVSGKDWMRNSALSEEVFGPLGLVVEVESLDEMLILAKSFDGQITCTLHMDEADTADAKNLMPILERKAGRILANGFPTGVEVSDTMVHGGPYPASTNFGATSVGTLSIRRFLRPVCFQEIPKDLLPTDLQ